MNRTVERGQVSFSDARRTVLDENERLLESLDDEGWEHFGEVLSQGRAVFVIGSGRSGLAAQMAAMRLMHLGLRVHVAGEVTAPAIGAGDVLLAVSGSGTTAAVVQAAEVARGVGAIVVAVTTAAQSPLAQRCDHALVLAAADKQDHSTSVTRQYAGSLFEQSLLLALDAQFHMLWRTTSLTPEQLWTRHANIG
ncbi:3-hexulose-6-phosphate isomerase [Mycobacterium sp. MS1601]|uniref:6-phospho-3-hexuloisomerase n=1 Tax=Mycobacterium sp. MS1601 TaxID=1936029 RepID=UPI0009792024|nr:6-phospho-3-hexuloisomerase [Mycobacterium sp. MS1601]AQA06023.1 3-hexulose-6-phosphate isomerase [Mycobacterium sp. MS1601]